MVGLKGLLVALALALTGTPAGPAAAQKPPDPKRLTLSFSGDLLIHSPVFQQALANGGGARYDFAPMFEKLRRWVERPTLAFCHVEVPMTSERPYAGYPLFNSPPALADGLAESGWDACDTASNHSLDQGQTGIEGTVEALNENDLEHTGSYPTKRSSERIAFVRAKGVRIALLAYTTDTNGLIPPHSWSLNILREPKAVIRDARRARRAGADAVIVNIHWGPSYAPEYVTSTTEAQEDFAKELTEARAITAIVGQGPHVVQRIEWFHRKPVVFGEGNLISNQTDLYTQDGLVALITLIARGDRVRPVMVRYVPTFVRHPDYVVIEAPADSWRRTVGVVGREKRVKPVPRSAP